jgi:hypothetical protein
VRRKWLIERPFNFGCACVVSAVLIGVAQEKTLEQQALNVVLGFVAGAALSGLILLVEWMVSRFDPS